MNDSLSKNTFLKACPVFPAELRAEMNVSLLFVTDLPFRPKAILKIAGESDYQIYLNGDFLAYGPARGPRGSNRIDFIPLKLQKRNRIVVLLNSANCDSFDRPKASGFLVAEIVSEGKPIRWTGRNFLCFRDPNRLQKVCRFSYQRTFSESYRGFDRSFFNGGPIGLDPLPLSTVRAPLFLPRLASYPSYRLSVFSLLEGGTFSTDVSLLAHRDRYMTHECLGLFPIETWEENPNDEISRLIYRKEKPKSVLASGDFLTYSLPSSLTGFSQVDIEVKEPCYLAIVFDEYDSRKNPNDPIGIDFKRNTTQNIISFRLKEGSYRLVGFEPYTFHFLRVLVLVGSCRVQKVSLLRYENPDTIRSSFACADPKVSALFAACKSTFAQNAVDILTDCPSRERAGWLHDSFFTGESELFLTGRHLVECSFLFNYAFAPTDPTIPKGMVPMCYPASFAEPSYIPNWALWYILELERYFQEEEASLLGKACLQKIKGILSFFSRYENADGLLENLPGWVFVEWSPENDPESISGVNYPSNMLYVGALESASVLLCDTRLFSKARRLKEKIAEQSFDGRYFHDNALRDKQGHLALTSRLGETTQYYAFYFGIAEKSDYQELVDDLLKNYGPLAFSDRKGALYPSNVLPGYFLRLSLLSRWGEAQRCLDEAVGYFYPMAKLTGTLWELASPSASLDHAFTSYLVVFLLSSLGGLRRISPLKKTIVCSHRHLNLDFDFALVLKDGPLRFSLRSGTLLIMLPAGYSLSYMD